MPASAACCSGTCMRQRGNQYREHMAETAPHVLDYAVELVMDGRTLERPTNYGLVRIVPPKGVVIDPQRRPFVVVDPRAGHGPGHRRLQGRQRDRRRAQGRPSLLFRRLPARARAGPDHRGRRACRGDVSREGHFAASGRGWKAVRHRQLSGRLGGDDSCGASPGARRAARHRRSTAVLLGRRARKESDALLRRTARRQLAHRA